VAIVNETFARKFGLGRDAVGKRMAFDGDSPEGVLDVEIVGLMRDARYADVKGRGAAARAHAVPPEPGRGRSRVLRAHRPARRSACCALPAAVARLDRNLPVSMLKTLPQQVRENVYLDRMIGARRGVRRARDAARRGGALRRARVHGGAAHARDRRAHGARRRRGRVRGLVLGRSRGMAVGGGALGVLGALAVGGVAQSLLFGLDARDPATFAGAAAARGGRARRRVGAGVARVAREPDAGLRA
jgi:hypothetical protein